MSKYLGGRLESSVWLVGLKALVPGKDDREEEDCETGRVDWGGVDQSFQLQCVRLCQRVRQRGTGEFVSAEALASLKETKTQENKQNV